MRVVFTSVAVPAHFLGQVPLAWALRSAGHEVRVASHPALTPTITAAGLPAVPVGEDHTMMEAIGADPTDADRGWDPTFDLDPVHPRVHHPAFVRVANRMLTERFYAHANNEPLIDGLVRFARSWRPDLVVWEPFTIAGAIAAESVGAAHARLSWGADLALDQREALLQESGDDVVDPLAEWLEPVLDRYGLVFDERLVRGHWTIDTMPAPFRLPLDVHTEPMRYVPYNGTSIVPDWLREPPARPRVCVTVGITWRSGGEYLADALSTLFDAVADLDVEIVAPLNAEALACAGSTPDNVRTVEFVPLHALLPTCAAVAHHGGAGTWSTACVTGVPQLVFPSVWDDFYRARRTAELGAGMVIPAGELTPTAFRDGLRRLVDEPSFADAADRLRRAALAEPSPADVAARLEGLTARHRDGEAF